MQTENHTGSKKYSLPGKDDEVAAIKTFLAPSEVWFQLLKTQARNAVEQP